MKSLWTRRGVLAAVGAAAFVRPASADNGLLEKLRKQGSIKVGIANNMPWSTLNPDGTLSGIAPSITKAVVTRLGIPKIEGVIATYGELVPGLLAGRWDMIGASLTISPERCAAIAYSDPFYRKNETQWVSYLKSEVPDPPKSYTEVGKRFDRIGIATGSSELPNVQAAVAAGIKGTIVQFPTTDLGIEGLMTKRISIYLSDDKSTHLMQKQRGGYEIAPVDSEHPNRGSGGAFRKGDTDLYNAFVTEFRALKKSGEVAKILAEYNFEYDAEYMEISGEQACAL